MPDALADRGWSCRLQRARQHFRPRIPACASVAERARLKPAAGALLFNWLDLEAGAEQDFDAWHNREHAAERVALPGFRRCRRYVATEPAPAAGFGLLIVYDGDHGPVFSSEAYAARLNDPTPQTAAIVPRLRNVSRALVTVEKSSSVGVGAWACTATIGAERGATEIWPRVQEILAIPSFAELTLGCRGNMADAKAGTLEQARTDSLSTDVAAVLLIGASRPAGIEQAIGVLRRTLGHLQPEIRCFQLAFLLDGDRQPGVTRSLAS